MLYASAQSNPERGARRQPSGRIYGKVIDAKTNKGFDAASVQIIKKVADPAGGLKDSIIAGMLTPSNGNLSESPKGILSKLKLPFAVCRNAYSVKRQF